MCLVRLPSVRAQWQDGLVTSFCKKVMTHHRWTVIHGCIRTCGLQPDEVQSSDKLWKVRGWIDQFNTVMPQLVAPFQFMSSDETTIKFTGHASTRMYTNKPSAKFGFRVYTLANVAGCLFRMEPYSGQSRTWTDIVCDLVPSEMDNGGFVVVLDRLYASPALSTRLLSRGIHTLGTCQTNRTDYPSSITLKDSAVEGAMKCAVVRHGSHHMLTAVSWKDRKVVNMLTTLRVAKVFQTTDRLQAKTWVKLNRAVPTIVPLYNKTMGGVDLFDSFLKKAMPKMRYDRWTTWYAHICYVSCEHDSRTNERFLQLHLTGDWLGHGQCMASNVSARWYPAFSTAEQA